MSDGQLAYTELQIICSYKLQNTRVSGQCFHGILNAVVLP